MNLEEDNKIAFVKYRLEKSEEAYSAAILLYNAHQWNGAE